MEFTDWKISVVNKLKSIVRHLTIDLTLEWVNNGLYMQCTVRLRGHLQFGQIETAVTTVCTGQFDPLLTAKAAADLTTRCD